MIGVRHPPNAQCSPLRSGTDGVFGQKRKYYSKDGAIFLLFVVVTGERTMLHTGAAEGRKQILCRCISTHTHTLVHCAHTHSRVGRSVLRGVCTTRGKRSSAGNGRWPLLWRRSRRLVAVVVVDDDFSFSAAEATKYKHTTRRIATVACFSRITPVEHAYEWSLIFTGPALVILNAKTGHVRRAFRW